MICAPDTNRTSTNGHGLANREVTALSVYFFLFFAAMGCLIPFLTIFLRARGLSFTEIGICGTIWAVVGIGSQMVLGHLSDALGSRRLFAAISCVSVGMSFFFYGFAHSFAAFALLYAWTGLGHLGTYSLPQAIISDWTGAAGSAARGFSSTRVWGTIGFIAPLLVITKYPVVAEGTGFLYLGASLFVLSAVPILVIQEAPVKTTRQGVVKGAMQVLASQRAYAFLFCYFVFRLTEGATNNFMGIYLKDLGGGEQLVAAAFWISAVAETPVVYLAGKFSDRFGRKWPLMLAFTIWPIRLCLYSLITQPTNVYYIQLFQGFTFGIVLVVAMAYISDVAPERLRATAQGLLLIANAAAMAVGPLLAGLVGDAVGLRVTFRVLAIIVVAGLVVLVAFVREPRKEQAAGHFA